MRAVEHQKEARHSYCKCGKYGSDKPPSDTTEFRVYGSRSDEADISGGIDSDGSRCHLRDRHYVCKHGFRDPSGTDHRLFHKRKHGVTAAESEDAYLYVGPYEFEVDLHVFWGIWGYGVMGMNGAIWGGIGFKSGICGVATRKGSHRSPRTEYIGSGWK